MTARMEIALHAAFRATLTALSRPGSVQPVPGAGDAVEAARLVLDAVWEAESPPVIVTGAPEPGEFLRVPNGTEEEPELGATVVIVIDADAPVTRVRLSGPGVDGELDIDLPLSPAVLAEREQACEGWPCGIDLVALGPGPQVVGLPRTTRIAVLEVD
ncbi:phosphonate C-P lyase system protein PhnH [Amycolatopsis sp. K13G38]|uniref:Phosphonate C-P lyase system protein PhnH n=1 Tax=Amycolatopsis acididurans TaxID=2724524 RepID=A0ABX1JEL7_9PSEU|nr:phosphonate C-P lyase system protein PhnH [Amycolatopsis acididurans]NKQ58230.1 phosphonate C-P lyase system protein PhnH [Amycolatopsis acididurans]